MASSVAPFAAVVNGFLQGQEIRSEREDRTRRREREDESWEWDREDRTRRHEREDLSLDWALEDRDWNVSERERLRREGVSDANWTSETRTRQRQDWARQDQDRTRQQASDDQLRDLFGGLYSGASAPGIAPAPPEAGTPPAAPAPAAAPPSAPQIVQPSPFAVPGQPQKPVPPGASVAGAPVPPQIGPGILMGGAGTDAIGGQEGSDRLAAPPPRSLAGDVQAVGGAIGRGVGAVAPGIVQPIADFIPNTVDALNGQIEDELSYVTGQPVDIPSAPRVENAAGAIADAGRAVGDVLTGGPRRRMDAGISSNPPRQAATGPQLPPRVDDAPGLGVRFGNEVGAGAPPAAFTENEQLRAYLREQGVTPEEAWSNSSQDVRDKWTAIQAEQDSKAAPVATPAAAVAPAAPATPAVTPASASPEAMTEAPVVPTNPAAPELAVTRQGTPQHAPQEAVETMREAGIGIPGRKPTEKQTERAVEEFGQHYDTDVARKIVQHYASRGEFDKAQAFETWLKTKDVQKAKGHWSRAIVAATMGDEKEFIHQIAAAYNTDGYYDDGYKIDVEASGMERTTNGQFAATLTFVNERTGEKIERQLSGAEELFRQGIDMMSMEEVFETGWAAMEAQRAKREEAAVPPKDADILKAIEILSDPTMGGSAEFAALPAAEKRSKALELLTGRGAAGLTPSDQVPLYGER